MEKSYSEPKQARNRERRYSQRNIDSPFLDPIIIDGLVKSRLTGQNRCPVFS
jgi:hypothetical protein